MAAETERLTQEVDKLKKNAEETFLLVTQNNSTLKQLKKQRKEEKNNLNAESAKLNTKIEKSESEIQPEIKYLLRKPPD